MRVVADTGPLVAAGDKRDQAHELAADLITELGRDLLIPTPVVVETDHLLRARVGLRTARGFLEALSKGLYELAPVTPGLLRAAVDFDARFADLNLGFVDGCVMAVAERERLAILTFDFEDFRATKPARGHWRLLVDEARYAEITRAR